MISTVGDLRDITEYAAGSLMLRSFRRLLVDLVGEIKRGEDVELLKIRAIDALEKMIVKRFPANFRRWKSSERAVKFDRFEVVKPLEKERVLRFLSERKILSTRVLASLGKGE